jgi:hypothetical protein
MRVFLDIKTEDLLAQFLHCFKKTSHIVTLDRELLPISHFSIIEGTPVKTAHKTAWISDFSPFFTTLQLPFSVRSFVDTIKDTDTMMISNSGLIIDALAKTVIIEGRDTKLTTREFDLLIFIKNAQGAVVSRVTLLEEIWGMSSSAEPRAVDVAITRIRTKLGHDHAAHIQTLSGSGYRWKFL